MTMIRTLIVDDEPLARRGLELRLQHHADIEIVGEAGNGREAFNAISALQAGPDVPRRADARRRRLRSCCARCRRR